MSTIFRVSKRLLLGACFLGMPLLIISQSHAASMVLPSAPNPILGPALNAANTAAAAQAATSASAAGTAPSSSSMPVLTRTEAEQMAIHNNPHVSAARLLALAQGQVTREARSTYLPQFNGNLTGVDAHNGGRVSAGALAASRLANHAGAGADLSQLITDFGHTHNLILSRKLEEEASKSNALATTEDIVMAADTAFYNALTAQSVLRDARQTVATRKETDEQIRELTKHNLRSTVDQAFADVNLSQAKLLELDAQNNVEAAMAELDNVLGLGHEVDYRLVDNTTPQSLSPSYRPLVAEALAQRPDLQALNYGTQSEEKFARAEKEQLLPTISMAGTAGSVPVRDNQYYDTNWWGGVGINVKIPIFNGFLYSAQAKEARDRAEVSSEQSRALRDQIVRNVRTAWLNANTAYQRVGVTKQLEQEANLAMKLAQARYRLGLSTIVELSQAELQQTSAQIEHSQARYSYRLALATVNYQIGANL